MTDLQDDVEHALSVAAVQLMAEPAAGQLGRTIERASSQLRLLKQLSNAGQAAGRDLRRPDDEYRAVAAWTETLGRAGFDVTFGIPVPSPWLPGTVHLTLVEALDVLGHLVLHHAERGSACRLTIRRCGGTELEVTAIVAANRGRGLHRVSGLAALRHRASLVGGRLDLRTEDLDGSPSACGSARARFVATLVLPDPPAAGL